jgi:predicted nucleic acid-binding protein
MKTEYLVDSSAWIDYFLANEPGEKVKAFLEGKNNVCFTSALSVAEVTIKLKKAELDYSSAFSTMKSISTILPIDDSVSFDSALLYVEKRKKLKDIGIVDVILMIQARRDHLTIITGDRDHFKDEKNVIFI